MNHRVLARRYAQAYCNLFASTCSAELIDTLTPMYTFFSTHKEVLFFLGLPQLAPLRKKDALQFVVKKLGLPEELVSLFLLVIAQKRAMLLPQVCMQLRQLILRKHNMIECTIASAQELTQDEQAELVALFAHQTKHDIRAQYDIDKTLIAGVAVRSATYEWEYSIRKQLQIINQRLIT